MAIRAYKVVTIEWEQLPRFNLGDEELMRFIEPYIPDKFTGEGLLELRKEDLEEVLLEAQKGNTQEICTTIQEMIADATTSDGWVRYMCY